MDNFLSTRRSLLITIYTSPLMQAERYLISEKTHCSSASVRSAQHPHCCFSFLSEHFRLSLFTYSQIAEMSRNRNSLPSVQWWVLTRHSWPVEAFVLLYFREPGPDSCFVPQPPYHPPPTPDPVSEQAELPADGLMYLDVLRLHRRLCVGEEKRPTKCFCFFTIDIDLLLTAAVSFCVTLTSE